MEHASYARDCQHRALAGSNGRDADYTAKWMINGDLSSLVEPACRHDARKREGTTALPAY